MTRFTGTPEDAAKVARVSVRTVRRWAQQGRIDSVTFKGKLWVDAFQVMEIASISPNRRAPRLTTREEVADDSIKIGVMSV